MPKTKKPRHWWQDRTILLSIIFGLTLITMTALIRGVALKADLFNIFRIETQSRLSPAEVEKQLRQMLEQGDYRELYKLTSGVSPDTGSGDAAKETALQSRVDAKESLMPPSASDGLPAINSAQLPYQRFHDLLQSHRNEVQIVIPPQTNNEQPDIELRVGSEVVGTIPAGVQTSLVQSSLGTEGNNTAPVWLEWLIIGIMGIVGGILCGWWMRRSHS